MGIGLDILVTKTNYISKNVRRFFAAFFLTPKNSQILRKALSLVSALNSTQVSCDFQTTL
jgi:hypothetical protein